MTGTPTSVNIRRHGSYNFEKHYESLCALQDSVPLVQVKAYLSQGILDFNADRVRLSDWGPILKTLSINKSLQFVAIRSYINLTNQKDKKQYFCRREPAISTKDLKLRLAAAIKQCVQASQNITCLELQGIDFRDRDISILAQGIAGNKSLTHLSLEYCSVGDKGCHVLSEAVKNHKSITHFNLSGCKLTWNGAETLAKLIKFQSTVRHSAAWADSLRYSRPDIDGMKGIRRITLNNNPLVGDIGAMNLAEALKDDMWLKALDIQQCGISRDGALGFIDMLSQNSTIIVLDIRQNPLIDRLILHDLLEKVLMNSNGNDVNEFPWLVSEQPADPYRTNPRKKTRRMGSGYGKWKSANTSDPLRESHVPFHTASRAQNYKKMSSDGRHSAIPKYLQNAEVGQVTVHIGEETSIENESSNFCGADAGELSPIKPSKNKLADDLMQRNPVNISIPGYQKQLNKLKGNLVETNRLLVEEQKARRLAEQRAINFEIRNIQLEKDIMRLKKQINDQADINTDEIFDEVEHSFQQFHNFLDILNQLGLGGLAAYAGIGEMKLPSAAKKEVREKTVPHDEINQAKTPVMGTHENGDHKKQTIIHAPYTGDTV